jgi:hypothetical protein
LRSEGEQLVRRRKERENLFIRSQLSLTYPGRQPLTLPFSIEEEPEGQRVAKPSKASEQLS